LQQLAIANEMNYDEAMAALTRKYDGYRFTNDDDFSAMFNPFSVLNALSERSFKNYWFDSSTHSFLRMVLENNDFDLSQMDEIIVQDVSLYTIAPDINRPLSIIYQIGYLTKTSYDNEFNSYSLGFPNDEVKYGYLNFADKVRAQPGRVADSVVNSLPSKQG
jgi:hypothetical protein